MMKKLIALIGIIALLSPSFAFADTTITTAGGHEHFGNEVCFAAGDRAKRAVTFTANGTGTVSSISSYLGKIGSPTNTLTISIQGDSSGSPDGSNIGSGTLSSSSLSTSEALVAITLSSPASLTNGVTYWVVWQCDTNSSSNYIVMSASAVSGNTSKTFSGSWIAFSEFFYSTFTIVTSSTSSDDDNLFLLLFGY